MSQIREVVTVDEEDAVKQGAQDCFDLVVASQSCH